MNRSEALGFIYSSCMHMKNAAQKSPSRNISVGHILESFGYHFGNEKKRRILNTKLDDFIEIVHCKFLIPKIR